MLWSTGKVLVIGPSFKHFMKKPNGFIRLVKLLLTHVLYHLNGLVIGFSTILKERGGKMNLVSMNRFQLNPLF